MFDHVAVRALFTTPNERPPGVNQRQPRRGGSEQNTLLQRNYRAVPWLLFRRQSHTYMRGLSGIVSGVRARSAQLVKVGPASPGDVDIEPGSKRQPNEPRSCLAAPRRTHRTMPTHTTTLTVSPLTVNEAQCSTAGGNSRLLRPLAAENVPTGPLQQALATRWPHQRPQRQRPNEERFLTLKTETKILTS